MGPKFSIIIPVYNVAPYLRECLDSVLAQTFTDWEAICVDDGSTDGSGAILDEYARRDLRIRVLHKKNGGVGSARNAALSMPLGEYVWFVDADDVMHRQALSMLVLIFERFNVDDICIGYREFVDQVGFEEVNGFENRVSVCKTHNSASYGKHRMGMWSVVHKRANIDGLTFSNCCMGEDGEFNLAVFWRTNCWAMVDIPLYGYRIRRGSACNSGYSAKIVEDHLVTELHYLDLIVSNSNKWNPVEMAEFFKWNSDFVYRTFRCSLFYLSNANYKTLLPIWVSLQKHMAVLRPISVFRKFAIRLLLAVPSVYLGRIVVAYYPMSVKRIKSMLRALRTHFRRSVVRAAADTLD